MKVHFFNLLLLITVAGCLCITLSQSSPEARPIANLNQAFITVAPTVTPHPLDAYRAQREKQRIREEKSLSALMQSSEGEMASAARETLLSLQRQMEMELQTEGVLSSMGYERAVCILQGKNLFLFTEETVSEKHLPLLLQAAAEICSLSPEQVHWMVP